jgi:hypothetical protein
MNSFAEESASQERENQGLQALALNFRCQPRQDFALLIVEVGLAVGFCFFEGLCAGVECFFGRGSFQGDRTFKNSRNHAALMCSGTQFRKN